MLDPNESNFKAPPAPSSGTVVAATPTPDTNEVTAAPAAASVHDNNDGSVHDNVDGDAIVEDAGDVWNRWIAEEEAAKARAAASAAPTAERSTPNATEGDAGEHSEDTPSPTTDSSKPAALPPTSCDSPTPVPESPLPTQSTDSSKAPARAKPQPSSEQTADASEVAPVAEGPTATETLAALDEKLRVLSTTQAPPSPITEQGKPNENSQQPDAKAFAR